MAKQSLEWHQECLRNSRAWLKDVIRQRDLWQEAVDRGTQQVLVYEQQVAEAIRRGMDGFDQERFLQKRKK